MPKNANQNKKYVKFTNGHFFWDTLYKPLLLRHPNVLLFLFHLSYLPNATSATCKTRQTKN